MPQRQLHTHFQAHRIPKGPWGTSEQHKSGTMVVSCFGRFSFQSWKLTGFWKPPPPSWAALVCVYLLRPTTRTPDRQKAKAKRDGCNPRGEGENRHNFLPIRVWKPAFARKGTGAICFHRKKMAFSSVVSAVGFKGTLSLQKICFILFSRWLKQMDDCFHRVNCFAIYAWGPGGSKTDRAVVLRGYWLR